MVGPRKTAISREAMGERPCEADARDIGVTRRVIASTEVAPPFAPRVRKPPRKGAPALNKTIRAKNASPRLAPPTARIKGRRQAPRPARVPPAEAPRARPAA